MVRELQLADQKSAETRLRLLLDLFHDVFGQDSILVDSSKKTRYLERLLQVHDIDLRVIHLIKDVRAFTVSAVDTAKRRQHGKGTDGGFGSRLPDPVKFRPLRAFRSWYWRNREIETYLEVQRLKRFRVGYEALCLQTSSIVGELSRFLAIDYEPSMLDIGRSQGHAALGNRMRLQSDKRKAIQYDNRWFYRNEWLVPYVLFRTIAKYNMTAVYSHTKGGVWSD
ncbi:hypothetical protein ACFLUM_03350 [Chloroflexota bacterium]